MTSFPSACKHEWMHVWGTTKHGGRRVGETACDRFALQDYRRRLVTIEDAETSLNGAR